MVDMATKDMAIKDGNRSVYMHEDGGCSDAYLRQIDALHFRYDSTVMLSSCVMFCSSFRIFFDMP